MSTGPAGLHRKENEEKRKKRREGSKDRKKGRCGRRKEGKEAGK